MSNQQAKALALAQEDYLVAQFDELEAASFLTFARDMGVYEPAIAICVAEHAEAKQVLEIRRLAVERLTLTKIPGDSA